MKSHSDYLSIARADMDQTAWDTCLGMHSAQLMKQLLSCKPDLAEATEALAALAASPFSPVQQSAVKAQIMAKVSSTSALASPVRV